METEGIFSGVEFLQVKRCFLVLTKLQLDIYQSSQSKSCTQSTYYADSPAAHSEGGTVPPPRKACLDFRRQRRWTDGERNKHNLGMHAEGEVCPSLLQPILCAPVWIHSSVSNVNLSKPFKNTHFSSQ